MTVAGRDVRFIATRYTPGDTEHEIEAAFPSARSEIRSMTLREMFIALSRHRRSRTGERP